MFFNETSNEVMVHNGSQFVPMGRRGGGGMVTTNETTCDVDGEGSVKYNSTSKNIEFCDGTTWQGVAPLSVGMVAGRVTVGYSSLGCGSGWTTCSCSAAAPGVCKAGTSSNDPLCFYSMFQAGAGCKPGWTLFRQSSSGDLGNGCSGPDWEKVIYSCSYDG